MLQEGRFPLPERTKEVKTSPEAAMAGALGGSLRLWGALGWVGREHLGARAATVGYCYLLLKLNSTQNLLPELAT